MLNIDLKRRPCSYPDEAPIWGLSVCPWLTSRSYHDGGYCWLNLFLGPLTIRLSKPGFFVILSWKLKKAVYLTDREAHRALYHSWPGPVPEYAPITGVDL